MGTKAKQHQKDLAESARAAAAKARKVGTPQAEATAKMFDRIAAAHDGLAK